MSAPLPPPSARERQLRRSVAHGLCWFALLLGSVFVIWTSASRHANLNDDALITLTYSKNIAQGNGFVFNHPPATLGTTTPLFAIVVGLLGRVFPAEITQIAASLSVMAMVGVGWLLLLQRRVLGLRDYEAVVLAFAIFSSTGNFFYVGSEYLPFQFLLLSSFLLYLHHQMFAAGLCVGLLFLTRGEGLLLLPVLGLAHVLRAHCDTPLWRVTSWPDLLRRAWRGVLSLGLGFSLVFACWVAYAWPTFGMILPNTLQAKRIQGADLGQAPDFLWQTLRDCVYWAGVDSWLLSWLRNLLGLVGLAAVLRWRGPLLLYVAWIVPYVVGYSLLRVPGAYTWYQLPVFYVWMLLIGLGIVATMRYLGGQGRGPRWLRVSLLVLVPLLGLLPPTLKSVRITRTWQGDPRSEVYRVVADWLVARTQPSDRVAAKEVGYLGYYSQNKVIDLFGLVSPDVLARFKSYEHEKALAHYQPEYYIAVIEQARVARASVLNIGDVRYLPMLNKPMHQQFPPFDVSVVLYKRTGKAPTRAE